MVLCRLERGDRHRVDDVTHERTPGQIVDRSPQSLQHRSDGDRPGRTLDRLVGVVAGVEVREHEDGGPARDLAAGQLRACDARVDGRVVLDRAVHGQGGPAFAHQRSRRPDLVDVGALAGVAGRVGQHRDTGLDAVEMVDLLRRVKADRPDLLVLDFLIQDEGKGWQFLQMLRMDRETRDIPVVVCTAAVKLVEDLQTHLDTMGVGVVLKPFDIDHLLAEINKMWRTQDPG